MGNQEGGRDGGKERSEMRRSKEVGRSKRSEEYTWKDLMQHGAPDRPHVFVFTTRTQTLSPFHGEPLIWFSTANRQVGGPGFQPRNRSHVTVAQTGRDTCFDCGIKRVPLFRTTMRLPDFLLLALAAVPSVFGAAVSTSSPRPLVIWHGMGTPVQ